MLRSCNEIWRKLEPVSTDSVMEWNLTATVHCGSGTEGDSGILLGPKAGTVTVGLPWDGGAKEVEVNKGLVECTGGMKYV